MHASEKNEGSRIRIGCPCFAGMDKPSACRVSARRRVDGGLPASQFLPCQEWEARWWNDHGVPGGIFLAPHPGATCEVASHDLSAMNIGCPSLLCWVSAQRRADAVCQRLTLCRITDWARGGGRGIRPSGQLVVAPIPRRLFSKSMELPLRSMVSHDRSGVG